MTNADKFKQIFGLYATELWSKTEGEFLIWLNSDFNQSDVLDTNVDDTISRQAAIDAIRASTSKYRGFMEMEMYTDDDAVEAINGVPSAQPEYYDYSDIDDVWEFYAEEQDINLTGNGKQLKDAMWVGYRKGKQDAQSEHMDAVIAEPKIYGNKHNCVLTMFGKCSYDRTGCGSCEIVDKIREAISSEPKTGWIPCSERLPKEFEPVLGTFKFQGGNACLTTERIVVNGEERWSASCGMTPIAWMPRPAPYKEGEG